MKVYLYDTERLESNVWETMGPIPGIGEAVSVNGRRFKVKDRLWDITTTAPEDVEVTVYLEQF